MTRARDEVKICKECLYSKQQRSFYLTKRGAYDKVCSLCRKAESKAKRVKAAEFKNDHGLSASEIRTSFDVNGMLPWFDQYDIQQGGFKDANTSL